MAAVQHKIIRSYAPSSGIATLLNEFPTGNAEINLTDSGLAVVANHQYAVAFTRANMQSLCIAVSTPPGSTAVTGTVTVYTNAPSGGAPQDTIALTMTAAGGQALVWTLATDLIAKCPFSANVTTIYVTNAATGPVVFSLFALLTQ
jgi:hypothetical protein